MASDCDRHTGVMHFQLAELQDAARYLHTQESTLGTDRKRRRCAQVVAKLQPLQVKKKPFGSRESNGRRSYRERNVGCHKLLLTRMKVPVDGDDRVPCQVKDAERDGKVASEIKGSSDDDVRVGE